MKTRTKSTASAAIEPSERPASGPDDGAVVAQAALLEARGAYRATSRGMYALGKALGVLQRPGMSEAAGHPEGFDALCEREFEMRPGTIDRLIRAASQVSEEVFTALGPQRVNALLDLATATEADDTEAILTGEVVRLWKDGPRVDVAHAPTEEIVAHAREVRERSLGSVDHAAAEAATRRLHRQGIAATVTVSEPREGAPSEFDVVGLDQAELERLTRG